MQDWPTVEVLGRAKDEAQNKGFFDQIVKEMKEKVCDDAACCVDVGYPALLEHEQTCDF